MPPFEFENWAVIALARHPNQAQVGDMGIDGRIFPVWAVPQSGKKAGELDFMDHWYPIQVKQKDNPGAPGRHRLLRGRDDAREPQGRLGAAPSLLVSFDFSSDAMSEIGSPSLRGEGNTGKVIVPLTVRDILDEELDGSG